MNVPLHEQPITNPARLWVPVFILFTLHNLEEIIFDMPAWGCAHIAMMSALDAGRGSFTLLVLALTAGLVAIAWRFRHGAAATRWLQTAFLAVMLAVFAWHMGISLATRSLQPGAATAIVFAPIYAVWLRKLVRPQG